MWLTSVLKPRSAPNIQRKSVHTFLFLKAKKGMWVGGGENTPLPSLPPQALFSLLDSLLYRLGEVNHQTAEKKAARGGFSATLWLFKLHLLSSAPRSLWPIWVGTQGPWPPYPTLPRQAFCQTALSSSRRRENKLLRYRPCLRTSDATDWLN